jgi:spore coat protein A
MKFSRSEFLRLGVAGSAGLFLPLGAFGCRGLTAGNNSAEGSAGTLLRSAARLPEPFTVPLPVPPVLEPARSDANADHYEITQKVGRAEVLPGLKTEVWGYDGIFPGPTIESRRGRRAIVTHRNELAVPTVVHLHGGRTPPEHDGYPTDVVMPAGGRDGGQVGHGGNESRGTREYVYPLDQPAATL